MRRCVQLDRKALRSLMHDLRPLFAQVPGQRHPDVWMALAQQAIVARLPQDCPDYSREALIVSTVSAAGLVAFGSVGCAQPAVVAYTAACCDAQTNAALAHPDALAWLYQYWREPDKDAAYGEIKAGRKMRRKDILAATQLFTDLYIVQWLLQNSLGRSYHELYPESKLPERWAYYLRWLQRLPAPLDSLTELTFIDPCCGSGLFLREAFDMFTAMYEEQHPELDVEAVANRVLAVHLHGIDLDPMVAAVARLVVYLCAWEYVTRAYPWDTEAYLPSAPLNILGVPHDAPEPLRSVGSLYTTRQEVT